MMGEPSRREMFSFTQQFQLLDTVSSCSASTLIRTEIGNGAMAGWGGVE